MKPALLYLKNYINEQYDRSCLSNADVKRHQKKRIVVKDCENTFINNKSCIFKEKRYHEANNLKKREFYFQANKNMRIIPNKRKIKYF